MVALLGGLGILRKTEKFRLLNQQMKIKCENQIEFNVIWEHNKTHLLQPWAKKAEDLALAKVKVPGPACMLG